MPNLSTKPIVSNKYKIIEAQTNPGINKGDKPKIPLSSKIWKNPPLFGEAGPPPPPTHPQSETGREIFKIFRVNFMFFSKFSGIFLV